MLNLGDLVLVEVGADAAGVLKDLPTFPEATAWPIPVAPKPLPLPLPLPL
jgi:hypothetical protein